MLSNLYKFERKSPKVLNKINQQLFPLSIIESCRRMKIFQMTSNRQMENAWDELFYIIFYKIYFFRVSFSFKYNTV